MQKKFGYIYITTNLVDGKKYIGQHAYSEFNENYKGSGVYLQKAIKKHGKENFKVEILEWCYSQEELDEREVYWIDFYQAVESDEFYNLAKGGSFGCSVKGSKRSDECKRRISESHKGILSGEKHPQYGKGVMLGKHHSKDARNKISRARLLYIQENGVKYGKNHPMYGKHHSEETKRKISEANKNPSEETRKLMSENHANVLGKNNPMYGKHHSEETKERISKTNKGRHLTKEVREKMSETRRGKHHSEIAKKHLSECKLGKRNPCYGKICVNDGIHNQFVKLEDLNIYLSKGYNKGRIRK